MLARNARTRPVRPEDTGEQRETEGTERQSGFREMEDLELLRHVVAGDDRAWKVFHRRFQGLIFSCIVKSSAESGYYLQSEDLNDVAAEVGLRMVDRDYRRLRMYRVDGGSSVATWVGVIASSATKDCVRRLRRHRLEVMSERELDRMQSPECGPAERLEDRERRRFVDRTLEELSGRDREFIRLYFKEAMSPEEIAGEMGISVSTVYSKKAKITRRLQRAAARAK